MPELFTRLVSGLLFPVQESMKHHDTVAVRRRFEDSQWWSPDRLQRLQIQRLRALLLHAQQHVPYYRDLFARTHFEPETVTDVADLHALPFLDKATIRAHVEELKADDAQGLARFNTGGSSGEPLIFFIGRERVSHDVAAKWRATRWWGVDIGDPEIVVWGSPIELSVQDRLRTLRDRLFRTELLPAFEMSEDRLDDFVSRIRTRRPKMLFGYPSALSHIALHAERRGIPMNDLGIRVAFCTSERLYEHQQAVIARVFGCSVANGYGARDGGFIAHQCPSGSMHITAEDLVLEIVDGEGRVLPPGQSGEVVVTHLATGDFPFIRYRTGDIARLATAPCPCGRGLPVLESIQGRATDFVTAADGTVMHGLALIYVLRDLPGVAEFRIIQHSLGLTRVQVVAGPGFGLDTESRIREGLRARLGQQVEVQVELQSSIAPEKSGKFRYVLSHVAA